MQERHNSIANTLKFFFHYYPIDVFYESLVRNDTPIKELQNELKGST